MKKFYFLSLSAFVTGNAKKKNAVKIFFIAFLVSCFSYSAFAQVIISPASDTLICSKTAVTGSAPACTTLGVIGITETLPNDFAAGVDNITLTPPAGWQFCTGTPPVFGFTAGGDVTLVANGGFTSTSLSVNITSKGNGFIDQITITGLMVQPLTTSSANGFITSSSFTGVNGIVNGVSDFGDLGEIPQPVNGFTNVCNGDSVQFTDPTPGGTWSSSNTNVSVSATGMVTGKHVGASSVIYTVSGCTATYTINVLKSPSPIIGLHDACAWFPRFYIHDVDSPGVFTSTGVTILNIGSVPPGVGTGYVSVNAPGIDTITFTMLPSGCSVSDTITIWPLPTPITGNDTICQFTTTTLSDGLAGGSWSFSNANASVGSSSGLVTGLLPGMDTVFYTMPLTNCKVDTVVTVRPVPTITSTWGLQACIGQCKPLTGSPGGGTWSSDNTTVATVDPSGLVCGINFGTADITYTLSTGCLAFVTVTVNPVPSPIIASSTSECALDSTIILNDPSGGGSWTSLNIGIGTIDTVTGAVYGVAAGVDTILYAFPTGCASNITVTVNPLPGPITGTDSVCAGALAFALSDASLGGRWSHTNHTVDFLDTVGFVTPSTVSGVDTVYYTLPTGCFAMFTLTVDPLPLPISGVNTICVGSMTTLSDLTPGGFWYSSNPFVGTVDSVSGVVTGITTGSTTITYKLTTGACYEIYGVTVTPFPSMIIGPANDTLCAGIPFAYAGVSPGGTWSVSNPGIGTIDGAGNFDGLTGGVDTIFYSLGGAGCTIDTTVTVIPFGPIFGPTAVCVGDSIQLSDTVFGGVWTSGNTSLATVDSAVTYLMVTGVAAGVDTIFYSVSPGGCLTQWSVTVNPLAPIIGPDSVCVGDTIVLSDAVTGGIWTSSPTTTASIGSSSGVVTGLKSGTIFVNYILPTGCTAFSTVVVNPLPDSIVAPDSVCQRDMVALTDGSLGGFWSSLNPGIGTVDSVTGFFTGISPGLDTVKFTLVTGGCFVTDTIRVNPIAFITGIDSVCVGSTTSLTDPTPGGVWSSSNTGIATVGSTGVVTGLAAGVDTIEYTILATGCSAFVSVTVDPLPGIITGTDSVCTGATTTLSDNPSGGAWSSSSPGIGSIDPVSGIVGGISAGTTTITYTVPTGACYVTTVVVVHPTPPAILPIPADVCLGFTIGLTDAAPGGVWTSVNTAIATIGSTGVDTAKSPGVDTVIYTLPLTGCFITTTVTVHAPPIIHVDSPALMCKGASETLTATGATLDGIPGTYKWSPAYGLSSVTANPVIASPTVTTTYTVVGTNHWGCSDTTTVTVVIDSLLNHLKITGKDSICIGDSSILIATGNIVSHFAWNPVNGLSCTICDTVSARPDVTTTYEATAVDPWGCKDSASFKLTVMPLPMLTVYAEPHTFPVILCRGTPIQLLAFGAWSYVWTPNLFLSCDSCANPVATDTANFVYELTGYSEFGCADSIPVKVSVLDTNYNIVGNDTAICIGTIAQLNAFSHSVTGNLDQPTYLWIPSDGLNNPNIPNPLASPASTTVYTLVITENACFSDTALVKVSVEPYPQIIITPQSEVVFAGTQVQMQTSVPNTTVQSYVWSPANTVSCDTCANPIVTPTVNTQYTVIVTSIYGCTSQDTVTINIACNSGQVFIPNTFTPNGDGMNDYFYISGKGLKTITNFMVYNRWGQVVFEAHNISPNVPNSGWDGTYKGLVVEPDVFYYVVDAICELGEPFKYKGDISLVR